MPSVPTYMPNPYGNFDPSQYTNPYSSFQNSGIPFPASYAGWPTDANGNPIQPPQGMTLNSSPAQPAPAPVPAAQQSFPSSGPSNVMLGSSSGVGPGGIGAGSPNTIGANLFLGPGSAPSPAQMAAAQAPQPSAAPPQAGPGGLTAQQYLQLRANPGYIATPGATVPQSQTSYQPGSGVLQQFLANWNPAQSGPGSGFQQQFAKALGKGS
jgi:hypothetical protein